MSSVLNALKESVSTAVKNVVVTSLTALLTSIMTSLSGNEFKEFVGELLEKAEARAALSSNKVDDFAVNVMAAAVRKTLDIQDTSSMETGSEEADSETGESEESTAEAS